MLRLHNKAKWKLGHLPEDKANELCTAFLKLIGADYEFDDDSDEDEPSEDEPWNDVLGVSSNAGEQEIRAAYREKIKQYHPDRVAGLGEKLRIVAEQEAQKINAAKAEGLARQKRRRRTG
jgi:DnaJ-class molecular chaperone